MIRYTNIRIGISRSIIINSNKDRSIMYIEERKENKHNKLKIKLLKKKENGMVSNIHEERINFLQ